MSKPQVEPAPGQTAATADAPAKSEAEQELLRMFGTNDE